MRWLIPALLAVALPLSAHAVATLSPTAGASFQQVIDKVRAGGLGDEFDDAVVHAEQGAQEARLDLHHRDGGWRTFLLQEPPFMEWAHQRFTIVPGPGASTADVPRVHAFLQSVFVATPWLRMPPENHTGVADANAADRPRGFLALAFLVLTFVGGVLSVWRARAPQTSDVP